MKSIFEAPADRRTRDRRRGAFSWSSFYAGVLVAMITMLVAYHVVPRDGLASSKLEEPVPAIAASDVAVGEDPADTAFSTSFDGRMTPTQLALLIETRAANDRDSAALERLRRRGNAPLNGTDRENAVAALVERTGKSREEAQHVVDRWISRGR